MQSQQPVQLAPYGGPGTSASQRPPYPDSSLEDGRKHGHTWSHNTSEVCDASKKLQKLNLTAFLVQLVTGVILLLPYLSDYSGKIDYNVYTNFPVVGDEIPRPYGDPSANAIWSLPVTPISGIFLLLSALDHFLVALPCKTAYEWQLAKNQNHFRWAEYAVSASLMRVMVALLAGILDIHLLFTIFGLTATTMLLGSAFEAENGSRRNAGKRTRWGSFWLGFVPHAFAWAVIFCFFFRGVSKQGAPGFVYAIIIVIFILDLTFAINLYFQWAVYRSYLSGEVAFIVLSFTSKQLLAWLNYGGGRRTK